jgi:hypothetical protein
VLDGRPKRFELLTQTRSLRFVIKLVVCRCHNKRSGTVHSVATLRLLITGLIMKHQKRSAAIPATASTLLPGTEIMQHPGLWKLREEKWQPVLALNPWAERPLPDALRKSI